MEASPARGRRLIFVSCGRTPRGQGINSCRGHVCFLQQAHAGLFFFNKSFITQIVYSLQSDLCRKLGKVAQRKLSNVAEECWAQRCVAKFNDLRIWITLKDLKVVAISSMSSRIVAASECWAIQHAAQTLFFGWEQNQIKLLNNFTHFHLYELSLCLIHLCFLLCLRCWFNILPLQIHDKMSYPLTGGAQVHTCCDSPCANVWFASQICRSHNRWI
jgi:hypothetical protein